MKAGKKVARPRWLVAWGCEGNGVGRMIRPGKIARLPRGIREELNRRLQQGERGAPLANWLNGLPETKAALARDLGGPKVTLRNLAEWEKGGFRDWQGKQETESKIVRQFWGWVQQQQTQDKLFGRPLSYFEQGNKMRQILGLAPLRREDMPPDEDWDYIPTRAERRKAARQILRLDPPDEDEEEPSTDGGEGSATAPPPAQSEEKSN